VSRVLRQFWGSPTTLKAVRPPLERASTLKLSSAIVAAATAATLVSSADAQAFWFPRGEGLSFGGNVGIGHGRDPEFNLDIRTDDTLAVNVISGRNSGRSTGILSRNLSEMGTAIAGQSYATEGSNVGVYGYVLSDRGFGVYGRAVGGTGVYARAATALLARSDDSGFASMFLGGENYFENNVGIGVVDPTSPLHVSGTVRFDDSLEFGTYADNLDTVQIFRDNSRGDENSTLVMQVGELGNPTDRVEIRRGDQTVFRFDSNGKAWRLGGTNWTQLSDRRLKHDVNDLDGSLEKLMGLRGVTFYYNNDTGVGGAEGERTGFIAQEVEEVFPEWITEADNGYKGLTIDGFEALTVEALRELREEKDAEIADLEAENAEFAQRLAALEAAFAELKSPN